MVDYHPFDEKTWDAPFDVHKQLRDEAPAYYLEEFDCWFLSRFDDIWGLCTQPKYLSSERGTTTTHLLTHQTPNAPNLTSYDGREHTKVRNYFNPFFMPKHLKGMEPMVRALCADAVDRVIERGEADAVHDIGGRVAVRVACALLGIPERDADQVMNWVNGYFHREPGTRGSTETSFENGKQLGIYLFKLAARARKEGAPPNTVLEKLLSEELLGEAPDDRSIAIHLNMLTIGGTETFPKIFSATLARLAENPDQLARCVADPELLPDAFHEALRYDMPTHMLGRTVAEDFELHGKTLRKGAGVMFLWGSANRDERVFDDPNRFDIERRAPRILSFGIGQHMCLGAQVAKMEGRILLEEFLKRIPEYQVVTSEVERIQSEFFRGFWRLPIRF